jgi:hypothetical protein
MAPLQMRLYPGDGALVLILPAGGFIVLGLLMAAKRALDARSAARRRAHPWRAGNTAHRRGGITP